jgi:drug/metabolite transporter (DMT)-like permease
MLTETLLPIRNSNLKDGYMLQIGSQLLLSFNNIIVILVSITKIELIFLIMLGMNIFWIAFAIRNSESFVIRDIQLRNLLLSRSFLAILSSYYYYTSLKYLDVSLVVLIAQCFPVLTLIFSGVREKKLYIGICFIFAGILLCIGAIKNVSVTGLFMVAFSAVIDAKRQIQLSILTESNLSCSIIFVYNTLSQAIIFGYMCMYSFEIPSTKDSCLIILHTLFYISSNVLNYKSLQIGKNVGFITLFGYSQILFTYVFKSILFYYWDCIEFIGMLFVMTGLYLFTKYKQ